MVTLRVSRAVRKAAELDTRHWDDDLGGACDVASAALARLLRRHGVQVTFSTGTFRQDNLSSLHCWLTLKDGAILDITATQFDLNLPAVYLTQDTSAYEAHAHGRKAASITREWWSRPQERDVASAALARQAVKLLQQEGLETQPPNSKIGNKAPDRRSPIRNEKAPT